ncbi:MAG: flagellar export chaperone FlgN [Algisphaera sp.]
MTVSHTNNDDVSRPSLPDDAKHLVGLLTRQRDLYQELSGLSARQQELIDTGRTEALLGVLTQRQALIDQLTTCNQEVAPLRSRLSDIAAGASESVRVMIRERVDQVQSLLQKIIERDEADRVRLEASRSRVGDEMKRVNAAPAAVNAYRASASAASVGGRFTDARG